MKKSDIAIYISAVLTLILTTFVVFSTQNITYDDDRINSILKKEGRVTRRSNAGVIDSTRDQSGSSPLFDNKVPKKSTSDTRSLLSGLDDKDSKASEKKFSSIKAVSTPEKSAVEIKNLERISRGSSTIKKRATKKFIRKKTMIASASRRHPKKKVYSTAARTRSGKYHIVKYGDTMWKIAQRYGTTTIRVIRANTLTNPDLLYPGMKIRLPS